MNQYLWTIDDLERLSSHRELEVRRWAIDRLVTLFPRESGDILAARLVEKDPRLLHEIATNLVTLHDPGRYESVLLARLKQAESDRFAVLAEALASIGNRDIVKPISERIERLKEGERLTEGEILHLLRALGNLPASESRDWLSAMVRGSLHDEWLLQFPLGALVNVSTREDMADIISLNREQPPDTSQAMVEAVAAALGEGNRFSWLASGTGELSARAVEYLEERFPTEHPLTEECRLAIEEAQDNRYTGVFDAVLREAERICEARCIDLNEVYTARESGSRLERYDGRIAVSHAVLARLAEQPAQWLDHRRLEFPLAVVSLGALKAAADESAVVRSAKEDPQTALSFLLSTRVGEFDSVVEAVASNGPQALPQLAEELQTKAKEFSWSAFRAAKAVRRMARLFPGECEGAIPVLITAIEYTSDEDVSEACTEALIAIGPAVIDRIAPHMDAEDYTLDFAFSRVLGSLPTERSVQILMDSVAGAEDEFFIERHRIRALTDTGTASALEYLADMTDPDDLFVARSLLLLCNINGTKHPLMSHWRRVVREDEESRRKSAAELDALAARINEPQPPIAEPSHRPGGKKKSIGKSEAKKRQKQRMLGKRKKKR